jgi:hypothetical protein
MGRHLFTLCAAASLVLLVGVVAARAASWWWARPFGAVLATPEGS